MGLIVNGSSEVFLRRQTTSFDPQKGFTVRDEYNAAGAVAAGSTEIPMLRAIFEHLAARRPFEFTQGPVAKLTVTRSGDDSGIVDEASATTDTWQILANERERDIREHPETVALEFARPGTLSKISKAVKAYENGDKEAALKAFPYEFSPIPEIQAERLLFRLRLYGVTSFPVGQYVLRHTTNVSDTYDLNVADENVEKVYSTTALLREVTDPFFWAFPMPGRLVNKIQRIEVLDKNPDRNWGWRKLPSTETTGTNNRVDISTEYWLAGWSKFLYATIV